jgi:hypothetical protein
MVRRQWEQRRIVRMCFSAIDYQTVFESYDIKFYRWCWAIHWAWKKFKKK